MKRLGIFTGVYFFNWDEETVEQGIGGSETWAYEVAKQFTEKGYQVFLYGQPNIDHVTKDGVFMFHFLRLDKHIKEGIRFDYFIYSRQGDLVNPWMKCDNIYMMVHDIELQQFRNENEIGISRVKRYGYLSEWHKEHLLEKYAHLGLTESRLIKVTNGTSDYYDNVDQYEKEDSIVWSSSLTRGFFELYEYVLWPVMQIKDFKIHICSGTMGPIDKKLLDRASMLPSVIIHGKVSKKELAELQCRSKVWIYPGTFQETFCITAVENAKAKNMLICPLTYGLSTTLNGYAITNFPGFDSPLKTDEQDKNYKQLLLRALTDENFRKYYAESANNVCSKYTWKLAADLWEEEFQNQVIPDEVKLLPV